MRSAMARARFQSSCPPPRPAWISNSLDVARYLLDLLDGLFLPGSVSNVAASQYGSVPAPYGTLEDPQRDGTVLPLIRAALARDIPLLAVCRGHQELNVALGGSLHQLVHEQPGLMDHREPKDAPRRLQYAAAHGVKLTNEVCWQTSSAPQWRW